MLHRGPTNNKNWDERERWYGRAKGTERSGGISESWLPSRPPVAHSFGSACLSRLQCVVFFLLESFSDFWFCLACCSTIPQKKLGDVRVAPKKGHDRIIIGKASRHLCRFVSSGLILQRKKRTLIQGKHIYFTFVKSSSSVRCFKCATLENTPKR